MVKNLEKPDLERVKSPHFTLLLYTKFFTQLENLLLLSQKVGKYFSKKTVTSYAGKTNHYFGDR